MAKIMNIIELQEELNNLNIDVSAKEICLIWGMDEASFSRKKKAGTEIKHKNLKQIEDAFKIRLISSANSEDDEVEIDYYPDVLGSCGNGVFELSQERQRIRIPRNNFFKDISPLRKYSVINAYGESMKPSIYDKDKLIIEHWQDGDMIQDGKIYVFCYNDQIFVKRLIYNVDEVIVKSDNPDKEIYKTKFIQQEDMNKLLIIGQIVGLARDLR